MGIKSWFSRDKESRASASDPNFWKQLTGWFGLSASGKVVNAETAMTVATVYACVKVISETVASLPVFIYRTKSDGSRAVARTVPAFMVLHDDPNPVWTTFEFKEYLQASVLLNGNAYCWIEYTNGGNILALWPLDTNSVTFNVGVNRKGAREIVNYEYTPPGTQTKIILDPSEVWHFKDMIGADGVSGVSRISQAKNTIGLSLSADEFGSRFFANDATPSGVLEYSGVLKEDHKKQLMKSWDEVHKGSGNAFKTALLEGGMKFTPLTLNQKDSQFIETRAFQVADVARIFRVPTIMIGGAGDADKSNTYASAEQQALSFVQNTIRPWLVRWEASIRLNLLNDSERKRLYPEFKIESLLRGDIATRYAAYQIGRQNSWLSPNDIRMLENMDRIEQDGADEYIMPSNFMPLGQDPKEEPPPAEPDPDAEPVQEDLPMDDDTSEEGEENV